MRGTDANNNSSNTPNAPVPFTQSGKLTKVLALKSILLINHATIET